MVYFVTIGKYCSASRKIMGKYVLDESELEELRQEARKLGRDEERYIALFRSMVAPPIDPDSIERARRRVQEILAADLAAEVERQEQSPCDEEK